MAMINLIYFDVYGRRIKIPWAWDTLPTHFMHVTDWYQLEQIA